jgi:hypothetical protein
MNYNEGVLEEISEPMYGGEAQVVIQLRNSFPGIGGTIKTTKGVLSAYRSPFSKSPKDGHRIFLKHMVIKKLEDLFQRTGEYNFSHVPKPMGSFSDREHGIEGYLYEYARGEDAFPWALQNASEPMDTRLILKDWGKFTSRFLDAGIDLTADITDSDNSNISKNIIHEFPRLNRGDYEYSCIWKRIDYGYNSIGFDYDKTIDYILRYRGKIQKALTFKRVEMLLLALEYLKSQDKMPQYDIGRLDALVGDYRRSSLQHLTSRGRGEVDEITHIEQRTESL